MSPNILAFQNYLRSILIQQNAPLLNFWLRDIFQVDSDLLIRDAPFSKEDVANVKSKRTWFFDKIRCSSLLADFTNFQFESTKFIAYFCLGQCLSKKLHPSKENDYQNVFYIDKGFFNHFP